MHINPIQHDFFDSTVYDSQILEPPGYFWGVTMRGRFSEVLDSNYGWVIGGQFSQPHPTFGLAE